MIFLRYFLFVLGAALLSAMLGGVFAAGVSWLSPEFVKGLFFPPANSDPIRYGAAVGMIWGLFLGTGVMGFCILMSTLLSIANVLKKRSEDADKVL